jgi:hypothetical protein
MNYKELYKYINSLFNQYFNKYRMSNENKEDLIQDIIIKLFKKEQEGVLSPEIEKNKNYVFISIRNEIHYRLYTKKNLVDYKPEFNEDMISFNPTIEQEIDKGIRYKQLQSVFKSKDFNSTEKELLFHILTGKEPSSLTEELNLEKVEIYKIYGNLKNKLKTKVSLKPKYLLIYENGKTIPFKSKVELSKKIGMSIDTLNQYIKLNKLKHKHYEIKLL